MRKQMPIAAALIWLSSGFAQNVTAPRILVTYPELIVVNAKIVTVDNGEPDDNLGRMVSALAVRQGRVLAVGTDQEIRSLAGPQTRVMDLKGRTVIPGIIDTHDHPQDWVIGNRAIVRKVLPDDSKVVIRYLDGPPQEKLKNFDATLQEAVRAARPGQWILIFLSAGPRYEWLHWDGAEKISKARVDRLAPNHPVTVFGFATGDYMEAGSTLLNSKGMEQYAKVHELTPAVINVEKGSGGTQLHREVSHDAVFQGSVETLAGMFQGELSWYAGYGVTTMGTSVEGRQPLTAYSYLDQRGELPIRLAWGYRDVPLRTDELALRRFAALVGYGSDHLWFIGGHAESGQGATAAPAAPEVKRREGTSFAPGQRGREDLDRLIKAGFRIATMHTGGDTDVDYFMDAVEQASKEAGFTLEQIRAKRHSFDHSFLIRPDQMARIKRLGMIPSAGNDQYWETSPEIAKKYGVEYTNWMTPRHEYLSQGIPVANEFDEHFSQTAFTLFDLMEVGVTRTALDGKTYAPQQAVSREVMLKSATHWSAYYVLREKDLGSLEPGKWADFVVLSRDYLTVPVKEIHTIEPLLTAVGGKVVHLAPSLAKEIGMSPAGAQVEMGRVGGNPKVWTQ